MLLKLNKMKTSPDEIDGIDGRVADRNPIYTGFGVGDARM